MSSFSVFPQCCPFYHSVCPLETLSLSACTSASAVALRLQRGGVTFFFFFFFFFVVERMWYLLWCREVLVGLQRRDAMRSPVVWSDRGWKPKLRSWAPRAEHLKPNSHEREVQCTPVALLSPVRRCISMKCTGSLLQHGDTELYAAPDNAGDHLEMELIHADKRLGFMARLKHEWKEGWRPLSLDNIVIKWTRFYECHHLCLCTDDEEELNQKEMSGIKSPRPERHPIRKYLLGFLSHPWSKALPLFRLNLTPAKNFS